MKWSEIMSEPVMCKGDELVARAEDLRLKGHVIYPPTSDIFRALATTRPDEVKVCIIGQDPYHSPGAANGLAFSINDGCYVQPSLQNIFKELTDDLGIPYPAHSDLTPWAKQGVLLLNTSLTVEQGKPNSHSDWGWQEFTGEVFRLCVKLPQPIVFILWGANARNFASGVNWNALRDTKYVIESSHPSPFSANRGFFGSRPFSRANAFLTAHGVEPIDWRL